MTYLLLITSLYLFLSLFLYFERVRESISWVGAERERENPKQACAVRVKPDMGLELTNHDIMT